MWVRSEYANELAVLSAWLTLFVPWNVASHSHTVPNLGADTSILFLRFPLVEFQYRNEEILFEQSGGTINIDVSESLDLAYPGTHLFDQLYFTWPHSAAQFYTSTLQQASLLWTGAAVMFAVAFLFSIALYLREDAVVERLPILPVRLMGILLGVGALGTAGASILYYTQRDLVGFPIPVGVIVIALLALMLLLTRPVSAEDEGQVAETDFDTS